MADTGQVGPAQGGSLRWAWEVTSVVDGVSQETVARRHARRRRVDGGRRHRHVVRVTPEEEGQLLALALRYHVSVPKLLVDSALAGGSVAAAANASVTSELLAQLFGVQRALGAVGNNLNQMTRATNARGELSENLAHTLAAVRRQLARLDDTLDGLAQR